MVRYLSQGLKNMEELQDAAYSSLSAVNKADAPLLSNTAGTFNTVFGAKAWMQLNQKANLWGVLPKKPFQQSGFRIETAYPATLGTGGTAETAGLPDTVKPDFREATITIKRIQHTYSDSDIKEIRFNSNDDDLGIDAVRSSVQKFHIKTMNKMLSVDVNTLAGNNLESIDRVIETSARAVADVGNESDYDIYGFDRSATTVFDAVVVAQAGASLAKSDVRALLSGLDTKSGEMPNVFICNNDVADIIEALYDDQIRYSGAARIKVGVNGIQTNAGDDVQLTVSQIAGIPLIRDADIANDYLYALNTEHMWIEVGLPTQNEESSERLLTGLNGTKGVFTTIAELKCVKASAQGKLTGVASA